MTSERLVAGANQPPKGKNVYFTYCGGFTVQNRLYLDVVTGNVFK